LFCSKNKLSNLSICIVNTRKYVLAIQDSINFFGLFNQKQKETP
jgi:hypothetical protein